MKSASEICAAAWQSLRERDLSTYLGGLTTLVERAAESKKIGNRFPFLSMGRLCLSQCTEYPFSVLLWFVPLRDGTYTVMRPNNVGSWVDGDLIASGTLEQAIHIAERELPADLPPVLIGDVESLGL